MPRSRLNPVRVYERWEAAATLLALARPPDTPLRAARHAPSVWRWRANPAGILVAGAAQHPERTAIVDEGQECSFAELERRTAAIASAWRAEGVGEGTRVGILAGNSRLLIETGMAAAKLGADTVYLNGAFSPPQVAQVAQEEGLERLVHDGAHAEAASAARTPVKLDTAQVDAAAAHDALWLSPPSRTGRVVILTSGTTGRPKGAVRNGRVSNPLDAAGILTCIPFAPRETTVVAAPMFHGLGLFTANLTLALGGTVVTRGSYGAERLLHDIGAYEATVLVTVPVMLQRLLELPRRHSRQFDTSSLRIVICGGAQLSGELARRFMDRFGELLYNVYGSTETALATVGAPRDLRAAPGTAGRSVPGSTVVILDDAGRRVRPGTTGRIFVGSSLGFDGYSGGGGKDRIDGTLATGDLGHVDRWGRLFIDGREDDMIVSGGENVFPGEVEELLGEHPAVSEVAVVGVPDEAFGQRLRAFVVLRSDGKAGEEELKAYVHDRLARFKTPREVLFMDALPRTATGKVVKRELRGP
jgi:fatty-acyl-CoA synthase